MIGEVLFLIAAQGASFSGELKEHLATEPFASLTTVKPPYDLEICVADVLTSLGTPVALRSGRQGTVIVASQPSAGSYLASATIDQVQEGTRVSLRVRGKGWNDRILERIKGCL